MSAAPIMQPGPTPEPVLQAEPTPAATDEFAIVEVFGHRRHVGRIVEVERFGAKMLRVDVPTDGDFEKGYTTHFYGGASIFGLTPTDAETVRRSNEPYRPAGRYSLPAPDAPDDGDEGGRNEIDGGPRF